MSGAGAAPAFRALAGGLDHPEGVAWDPSGGVVYAGGEAGQVYEVGLDGSVRQVADTGGFILGLAVDGDGLVYACDVAAGAVVRVDPGSGDWRVHADRSFDEPANRMRAPNWPAFDERGALYVTDSGDGGANDGRIWRVEPDGTAHVWTTAASRLPNGCCLAPDGSSLLVVETNRPGVVRIPILADGTAGALEEVARLSGTVPDGIAVAADGSLIVACYRPDALLRVRTDGAVETLVEDWTGQVLGAPANVAFVGEALDRVVTSNLGRWHVAIGDVGLVGAPLFRPRGVGRRSRAAPAGPPRAG